MPYSRPHTLIRILQLLLSTALVITAALLLTYRNRSHTNFTNEPLASCISGAVAFIYASWALMNHRRQPDSARWIYLHGFWCLLVCGLLLAGSSLGFVLGRQGAPCWRIQESRDLFNYPFKNDSSFDPIEGMIHLKARGLPTYQDGVQYTPGEYCKNDYYLLDLACAIMGVVAAGMWVLDFCLIFGFCGTSGQYGPFRRNEHHRVAGTNNNMSSSMAYHNQQYHQRRGQVGTEGHMTEEEDYYPAGGHPPPSPYSRNQGNNNEDNTIYNEHDHYYYDMLDQRKRELEWRENRTLDDPKGHVQGPIPLSMQQSYYPTAYPNNVVVVREGLTSAEGVISPPVRMVIRDDLVPGMTTALSPPPRPTTTNGVHRLGQRPDSPTLPGPKDLQQEGGGKQEKGQEQLPQVLQPPAPVQHTTSFLSTHTTSTTTTTTTPNSTSPSTPATQQQPSPLVAPRTPRQKTPKQTPTRLQHKPSLPALELPPQHQLLSRSTSTPPEDSTLATSPRYVVYPPGPACYVFDSSQQEYLPSFVNMAARIEQKQYLKRTYSLSSSSHGTVPGGADTGPSTPTLLPMVDTAAGGGAGAGGRRIMVTGLGMEIITRSSFEIEAECATAAVFTTNTSAQSSNTSAAATLGSQESLHTVDLSSGPGSGAPTSPSLATPSMTASRPQRIAMPSGTGSGSYFPQQQSDLGSPTGSLKSFTSRKSSDSHQSNQHPHQYTHNSPHSYLQRKSSHPHSHSPLGTEISDDIADDENEEISQLPPQPHQQQPYQQVAKKPSMLKRKTSKLSIVTLQSPSLHDNQMPSAGSSNLQSPQQTNTPSPPRSPYVGDF